MYFHGVYQQVLFLVLPLSSQILAYPVFGTKRYGRSTGFPAPRIPTWPSMAIPPYQAVQPSSPNHFFIPSYYTDYPYTQDYDTEYYYAPEPAYNAYPVAPFPYYSGVTANDNMNYAIYQSLLPLYYEAMRPGYGYYGYDDASDPIDDLHEEMQQDEEREERGDALPIGQETWFENGGDTSQQQAEDNMAEINAAFLQNLIISQMYNDAQIRENAMRQQQLGLTAYGEDGNGDWNYGDSGTGYYPDEEDKDVKELKSLVKKSNGNYNANMQYAPRRQEEKVWYGNEAEYMPYPTKENDKRGKEYGDVFGTPVLSKKNDEWPVENINAITLTERKGYMIPNQIENHNIDETDFGQQSPNKEISTTLSPIPESTTSPLPTTEVPDFDPRRGQKEVPLLRPAMPARHPVFEDDMDRFLVQNDAPRSKPSMIDTIKKLLTMEKGLSEGMQNLKRQPQKRFVTNEESLVEQLGGLKKIAA